MNRAAVISRADPRAVPMGIVAREMREELNKKGGAMTADAVYTNAPTQPLNAQAPGLCITRGQRNTHGVRTNG